nr:hypothetical protein PHYPA_011803 [Physcomitrium patens]
MGFLQLRTRCFDVRIQPLQQHVQLPHIQFPHHQPNCWRSLSSCRSVSSLFGIATASAHLYFEFMHISGSLLLGELSELGGVYFVVTGSPALLCAGAVSISPKPAQFVPMDSSTPFSNWVLLGIVCIFTASACVTSEHLAMESGAKATGYKNGKRKVIEHAVLFQLKADTHTKVKEDMVRGLADLKEDCPEWVVAESAGQILQPSQAKGASVGLFMRLFSTRDLDVYFASKQKNDMASKYIVPFMTGEITLDYEAEVDDNDESVYRQGHAFENGAERIIGIKVTNGTSKDETDSMMKSLNDLNDAPELRSLLVQITAGTNFCARDQRYTHGVVVRCPSLKALQEYTAHPRVMEVIAKTVWPIAEKILTADYIVDASGSRRSSL